MKTRVRATTIAEISQREYDNMEIARRAAAEGIVLLKNENKTLPIKSKKIALFGAGARKTIRGGRGSGEVRERRSINIEQALIEAGFEITTQKYMNDFNALYDITKKKWKEEVENKIKWKPLFKMFEIIYNNPYQVPVPRAITSVDINKSDADTAIYVLSRQAGEGFDRKYQKGDYELTDAEYKDIRRVAISYKHTIVVVNVGGTIDLSFMDDIKGIDALVYLTQPGQEGGPAFADIISGKVTPSGKLADTWAYKYMDYPSADTYSYINGNLEEEDYNEGIYVGYRYFDSFNIKPRYEFGFGLSYTNFNINVQDVIVDKTKIYIKTNVRNIGNEYSGKEVIQAYISAPNGELIKEYQSLAAFAKTGELAPGMDENLVLEFDFKDIASYSEERASWILEKGDYILRVGNSSRNTAVSAVINLDETVVTEKAANICPLNRKLNEFTAPEKFKEMFPDNVTRLKLKAYSFETKVNTYEKPEIYSDEKVDKLLNKLSTRELVDLIVGGGELGKSYNNTPGSVGRTTSKLLGSGIPNINMVDGPAGINVLSEFTISKNGTQRFVELPESYNWGYIRKLSFIAKGNLKKDTIHYQYCTAWPCEILLAQTWNLELIEEIGRAVGREMEEIGATLWLAPGMNIHRNPLCGRNFEYYSEDPFLTGKMAASVTKGVQSYKGVGTTIKHFCANNQEDNRNVVSSNISERTLREIYLKGFGIAVRESQPLAIMSSYNRVNGKYTSNSYDLCTKVLRNEWCFKGVVMTDWHSTENGAIKGEHALCAPAGNDIVMPGSKDVNKTMYKAVEEGTLSIEDVKRCAANVLKTIVYSNVFDD